MNRTIPQSINHVEKPKPKGQVTHNFYDRNNFLGLLCRTPLIKLFLFCLNLSNWTTSYDRIVDLDQNKSTEKWKSTKYKSCPKICLQTHSVVKNWSKVIICCPHNFYKKKHDTECEWKLWCGEPNTHDRLLSDCLCITKSDKKATN